MNVMERQDQDRAVRMEKALLVDGKTNIVNSLGARLGNLSVDGWPTDFTVYLVIVYGEQISTTDAKFCAGDRIKKSIRVDEVGKTLREWAKKGRLITSVEVY
jgi:hypothetical protein